MKDERHKWEIGLSAWVVQDGNYPDFEAGQLAEFALEFYSENFRVGNPKSKTATPLGEAKYEINSQVIYLASDAWVLDFGIRAYHESAPPEGLKVGDFIAAEIYLGIDPFFYFERLNRAPGIPPLVYSWKVESIRQQTAPFVETQDVPGAKSSFETKQSKVTEAYQSLMHGKMMMATESTVYSIANYWTSHLNTTAQPQRRSSMNTKDFIRLGVPLGEATRRATDFVSKFILGGGDKTKLREEVAAIVANPSAFTEDGLRGEFAKALLKAPPPPRSEPVKYRQWGEGLEHDAVMQMEKACLLPVAVAGALMPDAHVGYGLPIGGVLATDNVVIPYAVGVDIACRMKMTVLDIPARDLESKQDRLTRAIERETRFGVGANFKDRRAHAVMDADWSVSPITKQNKDRAWNQLGTSGSGNHFVEFGIFTLHADLACPLNRPSATFSPAGGEGRDEGASQRLPAGRYVALLSHSGSRGTGAAVCDHYSKIAFSQFPDLPSELKRLAWLSLDSQEGREYWAAMELMGQYAAANHACIHEHIAGTLGAQVLLDLENHHNFAWKERHVIDGLEREVVVHRKGATPAGEGVLGIIPGSMATPGFVVSGKGNAESLNSASHGAGRTMSRKAANEKFNWKDVNRLLKERGVTLISAGLDEVPMAYKNIREVMAAQDDLVTVLGQFDPKLVKMAPQGERAED